MTYSYNLCLCGEQANESGLCSECEKIREQMRPKDNCPYCEIARKYGFVVGCSCMEEK